MGRTRMFQDITRLLISRAGSSAKAVFTPFTRAATVLRTTAVKFVAFHVFRKCLPVSIAGS
jgi:hypothetical protein